MRGGGPRRRIGWFAVGATALGVLSYAAPAAAAPDAPRTSLSGARTNSASHSAGTSRPAPYGDAFVPVEQQQLYNSLTGLDGHRGRLSPKAPATFRATGVDGIPGSGVADVVIDVTVIRPTSNGSMQVYPRGTSTRGPTYPYAATHPSTQLLSIAPGKAGDITAAIDRGRADIVVNVVGYLARDGSGRRGQSTVAVPAKTLVDTRRGIGWKHRLVAGHRASVSLAAALQGAAPTAGDVIMAVTAIGATKDGYLTAWAGQSRPQIVSASLDRGAPTETTVIVPARMTQYVSFAASAGSTDLRVQLVGYTGGFGALPPQPCTAVALRGATLLDTTRRVGNHPSPIRSGAPIELQVAGDSGVPAAGATAAWLAVTARNETRATTLSATPDGGDGTGPLASLPKERVATDVVLARLGPDGRVRLAIGAGHSDLQVAVLGYLEKDAGPQPVASASATSISATSAHVTWSPAAGGHTAAVEVGRNAGPTAPGTWTDAQNQFGPIAVADRPLTDSGLQGNGTYSYAVFSLDAIGVAGLPRSATVVTPGPQTPEPVTNASVVQATPSSLLLQWTNPSNSDFSGVMIRRLIGNVAPGGPDAGVLVDNAGPSDTQYQDTSLQSNTTYSYSLFAETDGQYAASTSATGHTDAAPSNSVPEVNGARGYATVGVAHLSWQYVGPNDTVVIRRNLGTTPPASPSDGDAVATVSYPDQYDDATVSDGQTYSYSLFMEDSSGDYASPATVTLTVPRPGGPLGVCGHIATDQEWSPQTASVYVLTCDVIVDPTATLTIDAGTVVKAAPSAGLDVEGQLHANGSDQQEVVFTSLKDDSVGGDTNNDSNQTSPAVGDWTTVMSSRPSATSGAPTLDLTSAVIEYTGSSVGAVWSQAGRATLTDILVRNSASAGIAVTGQDAPTRITGSTVKDVGGAGILVEGRPPGGEPPVVENNTVTSANGPAVDLADTNIDPGSVTNNDGTKDSPTAIEATGDLVADLTLPASGLPWAIGNTPIDYFANNFLIIDTGVTLSLQPGGVLKVASSVDSEPVLKVAGSLVGRGTSGDPAVITSIRDDSAGGDTNGDGDGSEPVPGSWTAISTVPSTGGSAPTIDLEHTDVRYGGAVDATGNLTLLSDQFTDLAGTDGYVLGAAIDLAPTGQVTDDVENNTIDGVQGDGIHINLLSAAGGTSPIVQGNDISHADVAMTDVGLDIDPADLAGNTAHDDTFPVFEVDGLLTHDLTLPAAGLPWVVGRQTACIDYTCDVGITVGPGATLTLAPGEVLKFVGVGGNGCCGTSPTLIVEGTLHAVGTATQPVVLTSSTDDAHGGDLNQDGNQTHPAAGDWGGILTSPVPSQPPPAIDIEHAEVDYSTGVVAHAASVTMTDDAVRSTYSNAVRSSYAHAAAAINVVYGDAEVPDIERTTVDGADGDGIVVQSVAATSSGQANPAVTAPTIMDNDVNHVAGTAVYVDSEILKPSQLMGNTGAGDGLTAIVVAGKMVSDLTLPAPGLPWMLAPDTDCYYCYGPFVVLPGATLTLNAGTVLKMDSEYAPLNPRGYEVQILVEGALISNGTSANPVVLTSVADDSVDGDSNGDGSSTIPVPGDWSGIQVTTAGGYPAASASLTDTTVKYADTVNVTGSAHVSLSGSTISYMQQSGITAQQVAGGSLDIENSEIDHTGADGIQVTSTSTDSGDAPTITGNTVSDVPGAAVYLEAPDIVPSRLTDDSATDAHPAAIEVAGSLAGDLTLPAPGLPWVVTPAIGPYGTEDITGLTVPPGITMTMHSRAVLKFGFGQPSFYRYTSPPQLTIQGTLVSDADSSEHAIFTSLADDLAGGDTNGDADGSAPQAGDWTGVSVDPVDNQQAPVVDLANTDITYAATALSDAKGDASITGTIENDSFGVAGPPQASDGTCPDGTVTAQHVYWGTPTGPAPYGTDPAVSGCVDVQPVSLTP